jgi:hypothetical protein
MTGMLDGDVRRALHAALVELHRDELDSTMFVDEFDLCGRARCDVAVLNGAVSGYELKSANDSLRRLPGQVATYSQVLDYATLVVAESHAEHAAKLLPDWWGYIIAVWQDDAVALHSRRRAMPNPSPDPQSIALLLWRDEALAELQARGLDRGRRSWPRARLCAALAVDLELDDLRSVVRSRLKGRAGWRPGR